MIGLLMFVTALLLLLFGFPVAFTFGGVALLFGVLSEGVEIFAFMPFRIQSIMENTANAESIVRDADFAAEASALTRAQILVQSGSSMLSQANLVTQTALQLLQ